jgi:carboxylesterase type B
VLLLLLTAIGLLPGGSSIPVAEIKLIIINIIIINSTKSIKELTLFRVSLIISGLFHRAISQSGSCLNAWAFTNSSRRMAFRLGEKLGIKTENPQELLNHLRSVDTKDLTKASHEVLTPEASVYMSPTAAAKI